ncbi:MAG TPA: DoxX family protein [Blastocatellia bacterium]|nr:DoxX family protein [Blastocatellia bacterium]
MAVRGEAGRSIALLVVRAGCGAMLFYLHGLDKLKAAYGHFAHGAEWQFPDMIASAGLPMATALALYATFAEGIASLFLAAGALTRFAGLAIVLSMSGALYTHIKTSTKPELALLYLSVALIFVVIDPGRFALDSLRGRRR